MKLICILTPNNLNQDELRYMCATVYNILRHLFPVFPPLQVDQQVYLTTPTIDKQLHLSTPTRYQETNIPSLDAQVHPTTPTTDQLAHLQPHTGDEQVNITLTLDELMNR